MNRNFNNQPNTQNPNQPYLAQPNLQQELKPCKKCGMMVNKKSKVCPYCGAKKRSVKEFIIVAIVTFLCVGILFSSEEPTSDNTYSYDTTTSSSTSQTVDPTPVLSEEDFKSQCSFYGYEEISRKPNDYIGKKAKYEGKVLQVVENGDNSVTLLVDVTKEYDGYGDYYWYDTIYVEYTRQSSDEARILEDDIVNIYGTLNGTITYTTVLESELTIPYFIAEYAEVPYV